MNSTSCSTRFDSIAARSPARSSAGPDVRRSDEPSSAAMIIASEVLPRPGGPDNRMWSGVPPRFLAPSRTSCSCSRTRGWPMNSPRERGRRLASTSPSPTVSAGDTSRSSGASSALVRKPAHVTSSPASTARRAAHSRWWPPGRWRAPCRWPPRPASARNPRPTRASTTGPRMPCPPAAATPPVAVAPTLSRRVSTSSSAVFLPTFGIRVSAVTSPSPIACRRDGPSYIASAPSAMLGPIPETPSSVRNRLRASESAKPYNVIESSRTIIAVISRASAPRRRVASVAGVAITL